MKRLVTAMAIAALISAGCSRSNMDEGDRFQGGTMETMNGQTADLLPAVKGFFDGEEISFVHPEASDSAAAEMLTRMMDSPVLVVPSLAEVPDSSLAQVFVFRNGVKGDGPFGYQPDVFDTAPGSGNYSPLRRVHFVTWADDVSGTVLKSVREIEDAEMEGKIRIERSSVVVNMPFLSWPGGHR